MKKRTAILLSAALLCSMGGYVAWCFRPFYLKPRLDFDASVSPGGRKAAEGWAKTSTYPGCDEFSWSNAFWKLCHPWHSMAAAPVIVNEAPNTGLWAAHRFRIWTFAKAKDQAGGEWDASTVRDRGIISVAGLPGIHAQETLASRIDALATGEGTIEMLSLDPQIAVASGTAKPRRATSAVGDYPETFHRYPVLGRVEIPDGAERRELLGSFADSIREADMGVDFLCFNPRHAIIHTQGDRWTEYLICFECRQVYVFESGSDEPAYFDVSPHAGAVFTAFLDRMGIEQDDPSH